MKKQSGFISISVKKETKTGAATQASSLNDTSRWLYLFLTLHVGTSYSTITIWATWKRYGILHMHCESIPNWTSCDAKFRFSQVSGSSAVHALHMLTESALWHMVNIFFLPRHVLTPSFMLKHCVRVWNQTAEASLWNVPSVENYWNVLTPIL